MRWHRLLAMARKEVIQILRDWRSLVIVIVLPIVQLLLFGYGVSLDMKRLPAYVWDQEGSQQSQDLLKRFQASKYFDVLGTLDNYAAATAALDSGRAKLVLVVPYNFSKQLDTGAAVKVQALVDATDDNTANLIFGYSDAVVRGFSSELQLEFLRRQGQARIGTPLAVQARTWFNEELESRAFVVPGVVAIVMAVIGAFLTSLTIAREWERGTMEQLISTPVTPLEVMLGKLVPYFVIGMFDTALCTGLGIWWFDVPFRGHLTTLFGSSALFLVVVLGTGYLISVIAKTQLAASQIALIATFLPAFLLSGFLFAIDQMPFVLRQFTRIIPARYYVSILKSVFLKGTTAATLKGEVLALAIFAFVVATLALRAFHKRLT